jgi:hypothetical protein
MIAESNSHFKIAKARRRVQWRRKAANTERLSEP